MNQNLTAGSNNKQDPPQSKQTSQKPNQEKEHLTDKTNPEDLASTWRRTKCKNCGFVYEGRKTLKKCPKCGNTNPDLFVEAD